MQGPKYVESNRDILRYRDRSFHLHQQKLQRIRERSSSPSDKGSEKVQKLRVRTIRYLEAERQEAIKRENKSLMEKLVTIAEAKAARKIQKSLEPRSLNTYLRRKEEDRIRAENEAISRRLQGQEPLLSKKRMDQEYFQLRRYRNQISRAHLVKRKQIQGTSLQPLKESNAGSMKRISKGRRNIGGLTDGVLNKTFHPSLSSTSRDKSPISGITLDKYLSEKSPPQSATNLQSPQQNRSFATAQPAEDSVLSSQPETSVSAPTQ